MDSDWLSMFLWYDDNDNGNVNVLAVVWTFLLLL